jgi:hypothetical protein
VNSDQVSDILAWPGGTTSPVAQHAHFIGAPALDLDRTLTVNLDDAVPRCAARSTAALRNDGVEDVADVALVEVVTHGQTVSAPHRIAAVCPVNGPAGTYTPTGLGQMSMGFRALPARFREVLAGRVGTVNYQLLREAIGQILHSLVFVVNLSRSITGRALSSDLVSAHDSTVSPYGPSPSLHDRPPRRLGPLLDRVA